MLRIVANVRRQDVVYTYTLGQAFPVVDGKLISVELSGKELTKLRERQEIPLAATDVTLTWRGKHAGRILRTLKEVMADDAHESH